MRCFVLLLLPFYCLAQIPAYYSSVDFSKNGMALQADLAQLIDYTHTNPLPYTSYDTDTWDAVKQTDLVPGDPNTVFLFYGYDDFDGYPLTDRTRDKDLTCHATPCTNLWTREHVYAKSIATPSLTTDDPGPGTDVHNLRACDGDMNVLRYNLLFEDDSGNSNAHFTDSGQWYPGDEWKGDVARIIMYMHIRYPSQCPANAIGVGANTFDAAMKDVFLQWNVEDPVSAYELQRNPILESMQGNRNPFIDNPYLATKLWAGPQAEDTWGLLSSADNTLNKMGIYPTVVKDRLYITNSTNANLEAVIYTMSGQKINLTVQDDSIDMQTLGKGLYFVQLVTDNNMASFKFIKD